LWMLLSRKIIIKVIFSSIFVLVNIYEYAHMSSDAALD
jgi:heme/copper-type cytochrome/quinol oxidase subunit 3